MRALLQRVSKASVSVDGRIVGKINRGYVILLGVTHSDTTQVADWVANKVAGLRLRAGPRIGNESKRRYQGGWKSPQPRHLRSSRG